MNIIIILRPTKIWVALGMVKERPYSQWTMMEEAFATPFIVQWRQFLGHEVGLHFQGREQDQGHLCIAEELCPFAGSILHWTSSTLLFSTRQRKSSIRHYRYFVLCQCFQNWGSQPKGGSQGFANELRDSTKLDTRVSFSNQRRNVASLARL